MCIHYKERILELRMKIQKENDPYKPLLSPAIFVFESHPLTVFSSKGTAVVVMTTKRRNVTKDGFAVFDVCLEELCEVFGTL